MNTYTVKEGDTLSRIAKHHGTSVPSLQALNPHIKDANDIKAGWSLNVPSEATLVLPPTLVFADSETSTSLRGEPECGDELVEIIHITGEDHFYVLTEKQAKELKKEISSVRALMDELHRGLVSAPPATRCQKPRQPDADCPCSCCVKDAWAIKAEGAGVLTREADATATPNAPIKADDDLEGKRITLQQAYDWYRDYTPGTTSANQFESSWKSLQKNKLEALKKEISELNEQIGSSAQPSPSASAEVNDSATYANNAIPDPSHSKSLWGGQMQTGIQVKEVRVFGDPSRPHYITNRYWEGAAWKVKTAIPDMAHKPFNKQLAADLIKDVQQAIDQGRKAGPLGNLEGKINLWTSQKDNLLNAWHQEAKWKANTSDAAPFAFEAEGHALRFAASATAGVNNWNPKEGNIEVGAKGNAAFSLAEGSIALNTYFPAESGYLASMSYRNALGKEVVKPIGMFRLNGALELSCFAGIKGDLESGVKTQYKPRATPAGTTALLGTPTVGISPSGYIGVKASVIAGAQTGGALSGAFEWIEPTPTPTGAVVTAKNLAQGKWELLAKIKAEGNVALGLGGGGEFGLSIQNNRLVFECKAALVLGPGAGGGFGTEIDLEQVGKVTTLFCTALAEMDYRQLLGVTQQAFSYIATGLFQVATAPVKQAITAFEVGSQEMLVWWEDRKRYQEEAENLAAYINKNKATRVLKINGQDLPFSLLPPETMGPMIFILSKTFTLSFESAQEEALVTLLSEIRQWRHFIEVLEHCDPMAKEVNAMDSLARINSLLDGRQQDQFNCFVENLSTNQADNNPHRVAWKTTNVASKYHIVSAAQKNWHLDGLA